MVEQIQNVSYIYYNNMSNEELKVKPVEQEVTNDDLKKVHGGESKFDKNERKCPMDCKCHAPKSHCSSNS